MREERGQIAGDVLVYELFELWGTVSGKVKVIKDGKLYVRGAIYGPLTVEDGGRVHIFGNVQGDLTVLEGAKVILNGVLGGNAINKGGRLFIESGARVIGKIKTKAGETTIAVKARIGS